MSLTSGTQLGQYVVAEQLGAGGMGEVYKARDTKLDRDVALKILPDAFVKDPERLARFQREAKVLPRSIIRTSPPFMAWKNPATPPRSSSNTVEGPTLQDRIAQGAIPLDEALPIARQIAEALEAAHEQGIIHRDLKPANVKVKADGTVKVLDFGLAKALQPELSEADAANSPTMTAAATKMGVIMGTAAYMAPEQAKGRQVDKRADIWAFGVVLFEMLTGRQAFGGTDISETLAAVLRQDMDWTELPSETPHSIRRLLRRCLERDHRGRLPEIGTARLEIDEADREAEVPTAPVAAPIVQAAPWQRPVPAVAISLGIALVTGLLVWGLTRPAPAPITRMSIVLPQTQQRTNTGRRGVAISPTGTHIVYVANRQLYLRALAELKAQPLVGTEGSIALTPFFSPDGQWIGFYSGQDSAFKKVALSGGAAVTLTETTGGPFGASWGEDDTIVFGQGNGGIHRVSGAGGGADVLVSVEPPGEAHQPQMLPGGEAVLYTLGSGRGAWDEAQIVVEQVATGERKVVIQGGSDARYLPTGHLVYALGGTLLAVPFDVGRLEVTGGPVPLVEGVSRAARTGAANADVARTGALVYLPGGVGSGGRRLAWVDREGREEVVAAPPDDYRYPRLSPDGTRVAINAGDEDDIWLWNLERGTLTRLTVTPAAENYSVWISGQRVVFESTRDGATNLYWRAADGTGTVERLTESSNAQVPYTVSPDGTRLVFGENSPDTGADLHVIALDDVKRVEPLSRERVQRAKRRDLARR